MADQFDEWDKFTEEYEVAPTAERALAKYKLKRQLEGPEIPPDWARLRQLGNKRRIAEKKQTRALLVAAGIVLSKNT